MRRRTVVLALLLATACSSVPETSYYLLTSAAPGAAVGGAESTPGEAAEAVLGLGRIELADYLRQPGLVLETAAYQIRPATYHHWGEPLPRGVRRALAANLTVALPEVRVDGDPAREDRIDYRLDVDVERFHGTEQGTVVLGGRWSLHQAKGHRLLASDQFNYQQAITQSGYRASVEVQAELLARLSEAIARRFATMRE